jgi:hypothetical protein
MTKIQEVSPSTRSLLASYITYILKQMYVVRRHLNRRSEYPSFKAFIHFHIHPQGN